MGCVGRTDAGFEGCGKFLEHTFPKFRREPVELRGVDEGTAAVSEQPCFEIEILQGNTFDRPTVPDVIGSELGIAAVLTGGQRDFIGEQEVTDEIVGFGFEGGTPDFR